MTTSWKWTEQIDSSVGGAAPVTTVNVHTVSWEAADVAAYNAAQIAQRVAISDALAPNEKAATDYEIAASSAQRLKDQPALLELSSAQSLADAPALCKINADAMGAAYTSESQSDADTQAAAMAKALAPLFAPIAAPPGPRIITKPGDFAEDATGGLISMDAANSLYLNGRRMGIFAARRLVVAGKAIMAQGLSQPSVWLWNGSPAAPWGAAPITDYDPTLFPVAGTGI